MNVVDTLTQYAVQYGLQAAVALGILVVGMMVSRQLWRNRYTTSTTNPIASINVLTTS